MVGVGTLLASVQVIWPATEWLAPLDRFERSIVLRAAAFDVLIRTSDHEAWLRDLRRAAYIERARPSPPSGEAQLVPLS